MDFAQGPNRVREIELERLMMLYENSLLRMCYLYLHDAHMAEDAVQETFIKTYSHMTTFRGDSQEKTWLMRIAINVCKDMRRTAWFRRVDKRISLDSLPDAICDFTPSDDSFVQEVMRLPDKYKDAVLLYYYQDMTASEVSEALHLPISTVYARLKRAQGKLKQQLERWGFRE